MSKITFSTCLWMNNNAEEAATLYTSVFSQAKITDIIRKGDQALTVTFKLGDQEYMLLNGGPMFPQSESASIMALCEDQAEADRVYDRLTADGGKETQCGWLKDKFGVSWQIVPKEFMEMASDKDATKVQRMMAAMMPMKKLNIAVLRKAFDGR